MLFYIELSLCNHINLFYSISNIDMSEYRMFYSCSIKFAITKMSHLQTIFIMIKIEATKKRDDQTD